MTIADDLAEIASIGGILRRHYARGIIRCAYSVASHVGADHPPAAPRRSSRSGPRRPSPGVPPAGCDIEQRVAASMTQLGLTARLLSPVLAVACTTGVVLDVQLHDLRWQDELGGAFPLSLGINNAPKQPTLTASCAVAVAFCDFLRGPIAELITTVGLVRPVSPMIMWGNVASVVDSAITLIRTHRSDLDSTARAIAQAMFSATPASRHPRC